MSFILCPFTGNVDFIPYARDVVHTGHIESNRIYDITIGWLKVFHVSRFIGIAVLGNRTRMKEKYVTYGRNKIVFIVILIVTFVNFECGINRYDRQDCSIPLGHQRRVRENSHLSQSERASKVLALLTRRFNKITYLLT